MADTNTPTTETTIDETTESTVDETNYKTSEELDTILKELDSTVKVFKTQITRVRALKKEVIFLEKTVKKLQSKKNKKKKPATDENGEVKKNGFARPTDISTELADFLGIEHGVQIARTEVTKKINAYIKENDLQDPENRRCVRLESEAGQKLNSILTDIVDNEGNPCDLNFINIQKYIKHHFPKKKTVVVTTPTTSTEETTPVDTTTKKVVAVKKKIKRTIKKKPAVEVTA